jgi:hypothetical protein
MIIIPPIAPAMPAPMTAVLQPLADEESLSSDEFQRDEDIYSEHGSNDATLMTDCGSTALGPEFDFDSEYE